jgi:hypothetical protein
MIDGICFDSSGFFLLEKGPNPPEAPLTDGHNYKEDPEEKLVLEFYKKDS